jgi:hypothetical protein
MVAEVNARGLLGRRNGAGERSQVRSPKLVRLWPSPCHRRLRAPRSDPRILRTARLMARFTHGEHVGADGGDSVAQGFQFGFVG